MSRHLGQQLLSLQDKAKALSLLRLKLFSLTLDCQPNWVQARAGGKSNVTSPWLILMTRQGSVKAVLPTVGWGGHHLFPCSLKDQANGLVFATLCSHQR